MAGPAMRLGLVTRGGGVRPSARSWTNPQITPSPSPMTPWSAPVKASSSRGRMEKAGPPRMMGTVQAARITATICLATVG